MVEDMHMDQNVQLPKLGCSKWCRVCKQLASCVTVDRFDHVILALSDSSRWSVTMHVIFGHRWTNRDK